MAIPDGDLRDNKAGRTAMSKKVDLTGMRFGRLTALEPTEERKNGYTVWLCRCDCGNTVHAASRFLKNGWMTSCGCVFLKTAG